VYKRQSGHAWKLIPMATLSARTLICNVAALLSRRWGAVTEQAKQAGCSRQAIYKQEAKVVRAVEEAQPGRPAYAALQEDNRRLHEENRQLWAALATAVDFPPAKQHQFTATASGMGLSLSQIRVLLAIVLPPALSPKRATLGRWVQQAARRARALLDVLDRSCQQLVLRLCLDEIFLHRQPVLMGVEPGSLVWVIGQRAKDRSGETWCAALQPWGHVQYTAVDGGSGLKRGLQLTRQQRAEAKSDVPLAENLDNFHIQQEGQKALRRQWQEAEKVWEKAEAADKKVAQTGRQGQKLSGPAAQARAAWCGAEQAFTEAQSYETAYQRAVAALELFRPDGQLNDPTWAAAELRTAVHELPGERWAKFRRMALDPRALTFLEHLQRALVAAEPRAELRQALVTLWRLRHPQRLGKALRGSLSRAPAREAVQAVICQKLAADWPAAYRRVSQVFRQTVRASSVVECMNSVLRMHQARHRGLSQDLINLKRLYWNCRTFVEGKRKGQAPYQQLGLQLPSYEFWDLLEMNPEQLKQKVSTAGVTE
jgi:hypothetical protein